MQDSTDTFPPLTLELRMRGLRLGRQLVRNTLNKSVFLGMLALTIKEWSVAQITVAFSVCVCVYVGGGGG